VWFLNPIRISCAAGLVIAQAQDSIIVPNTLRKSPKERFHGPHFPLTTMRGMMKTLPGDPPARQMMEVVMDRTNLVLLKAGS
jgi:hypothetical protein